VAFRQQPKAYQQQKHIAEVGRLTNGKYKKKLKTIIQCNQKLKQ
jgi:hypothetical protein